MLEGTSFVRHYVAHYKFLFLGCFSFGLELLDFFGGLSNCIQNKCVDGDPASFDVYFGPEYREFEVRIGTGSYSQLHSGVEYLFYLSPLVTRDLPPLHRSPQSPFVSVSVSLEWGLAFLLRWIVHQANLCSNRLSCDLIYVHPPVSRN